MDFSPPLSKSHISVFVTSNGQRKLVAELPKSALGDFRRYMLASTEVPLQERTRWASHGNIHRESLLGAALFDTGRLIGELEPQAASLEAAIAHANKARLESMQALSMNRGKAADLVKSLSGTAESLKQTIADIRVSLEGCPSLKEMGAELSSQALVALDCFAEAESLLEIQHSQKLRKQMCCDQMAQIAVLCDGAADYLGGNYSMFLPRAERMAIFITDNVRLLGPDSRGREYFLASMSQYPGLFDKKKTDWDGYNGIADDVRSLIFKLNGSISGIQHASQKYASEHKRFFGTMAIPPSPNQDFILGARETISRLNVFNSVIKRLFDAHRTYMVSFGALCTVLKEQKKLEANLAALPSLNKEAAALLQIRQRLAGLRATERELAEELDSLKEERMLGERRKQQHRENHVCLEQWEKIKNGTGSDPRQRFTFSREPQIEPASEDCANAVKQRFVSNALAVFNSPIARNAALRDQFEATLSELAELYLKCKCSLTGKSLYSRFPKRAKHETVFRNDANDYDVLRIGLSSTNVYRLIIDVKDPRRPLIYFVGHKDDCKAFMDSIPRKIPSFREKALSNGAGALFPSLSPE
ncbi:MAG: hypothetical protein WCY41_01740 [Candidatus Micrarchaeia archaeon]